MRDKRPNHKYSVKPGDKIRDGNDVLWTIMEIKRIKNSLRYVMHCARSTRYMTWEQLTHFFAGERRVT